MLKTQISTMGKNGIWGYGPYMGAVNIQNDKSTLFRQLRLHQVKGYDYSRLQNSTCDLVEETISSLETARYGFVFSSGMSIVHTILNLFSPGDHIICSHDLYKGTNQIFDWDNSESNIHITYLDTSDIMAIEHAVNSNTKAIFVETPTNFIMKVTDLSKISSFAKSLGLILIVDNTLMTPFFQRPIELGADIVLHTGTKYLCGLSDSLAGFAVTDHEELAEKLKLIQKLEGTMLSPFDSEMILIGIKSLPLRMEKLQANAMKLAVWLRDHPKIRRVYYVGLPEHAGHVISKYQTSGFGGMISFQVRDPSLVRQILERIQIIIFAECQGGLDSLKIYPMGHIESTILEETREAIDLKDTLLRLSVGIEDVEDLIADLAQAMDG